MKEIFNIIFSPICWVAGIFSEDGRKPSFTRVAGAYDIFKIVELAMEGKPIPAELMTMFWVLIGYGILAKILNALSPAVLDIAKAFLVSKMGVQVSAEPKATQ